MMETVLSVLGYIILVAAAAVGFYFEVVRYRQAQDLHTSVLNACIRYYNSHISEFEGFSEYYELPSLNRIVYSRKAITAESYLSKESYEKLKKYIIR